MLSLRVSFPSVSSLADRIKPGCVPAGKLKKRPAMAFAKMEMIELFNQKIKQPPLSVPEHACFATPDLYEKQNMVQVITCLESVARKVRAAVCYPLMEIISPAGSIHRHFRN